MFGQGSFAMSQGDLSLTFAECAGRLSAEVEHSWLFPDRPSDQLDHEHRQFVDLVDAVAIPDDPQVLHHRIAAKFAHADLLKMATFGIDPDASKNATKTAQKQVAVCRQLLLGG